MSLITTFIQRHLANRPKLVAAIVNCGWLFADKILRMGVGLLVGVWVARYLGPAQFGALNYAMALVALFGALASLGLNGIVVRDLVRQPEGASLTLGSAFGLQLIGGFLAFVMIVAAINIMRPADDLAKSMVAILGFSLIFKATEVVKYWFESQVNSKYAVWVENAAFIALAAIRVILILNDAPLLAFVWAVFLEAALTAVFLLLIYSKMAGSLLLWNASFSRAKGLLMESWPLILGSMASMINMRMDQVMLGSMVNNTVLGNYSAAVRLAEIWLIFPSIIGASIYPSIIEAKEKNERLYRDRILLITKIMAAWVLPVAVIVSMLSDRIVHFIYGQQFDSAGNYLAIYIWTGVPYLVFFIFNQMFYVEGLLRVGFIVSIFSVFSNLLLNYILIPEFGGEGAAYASLATAVGATLLSLSILGFKTRIFLKSK